MIDAVLELNRTGYDDLATTTPLLINRNLSPTPVNFWNLHVSEHKHALKLADPNDVISRLYPPEKVSMTRDGIEYNGMYYSCDRVLEQNLASIARASGRWRLDARINENTSNYIYVKFDKSEGFTKCNLLPKSRIFQNLPMHESEFVKDWLDGKKEKSPINVQSIDSRGRRKEIENTAKTRAKKDSLTFSEKTKNTREHRKDELVATSNPLDKAKKTEPQDKHHPQEIKQTDVAYLPRRNSKKGNK